MEDSPLIDILLATYNGERFLGEQIESLLKQTYTHWRLLIRDDGSNDNTPAIIQAYEKRYPRKIVVIKDGRANLGASGNFGALLTHSSADYTMFCDQDDVWLPEKIEVTLRKMRELEQRHEADVPLLVYTDMKIVDASLNVISNSFWQSQAFNPKIGKSLSRFLVSNVATGCTVMINKNLRELASPLPHEALMHDWWVGLVSVALGKSDYISEPTMLYRQHDENVAGAKWDMSFASIVDKLSNFTELIEKNHKHLLMTQQQAAAFATRYKPLLRDEDYRKMIVYSTLEHQSFFQKRFSIVRYGFWWAGFVRSFVMFLVL